MSEYMLVTSANESCQDIQEIVANGGVDPREWVADWMEELLSLSIG